MLLSAQCLCVGGGGAVLMIFVIIIMINCNPFNSFAFWSIHIL